MKRMQYQCDSTNWIAMLLTMPRGYPMKILLQQKRFYLCLAATLFFILAPTIVMADTTVGGTITIDTTWTCATSQIMTLFQRKIG